MSNDFPAKTQRTYDVVALGESMMRLNPPNHERFAQTQSLDMRFSGAESNVLVALARWGNRTAWLSRLPDNALGHRMLAEFRAQGLDVTGVRVVPGERLGAYYVELGLGPRPNRVVYDRALSAASRMSFADVDLAKVEAARWLHLTGITPALSANCLDMTRRVAEHARKHGVGVSLDVNYRGLLWSHAQAREGLLPILAHVDVVLSAHRDAVAIFGVAAEAAQAAREVMALGGSHTCVLTTGEEGAVYARSNGEQGQVGGFKVTEIVDRIGAGDAFDAGFIHGQLHGLSMEQSIRIGHAASALKLTIPGDAALVGMDEIELLMAGSGPKTLR